MVPIFQLVKQKDLTESILKLKRIAVIGTCGAGKTSFARAVSELLNIPHIELDQLHWSENWVEVSDELFRQRVAGKIAQESWISDGNYSCVRDLVWGRVDTIIWLDYSFSLVMQRLLARTLGRIIHGTKIWHGNQETWQRQFFNKESILWWGMSTYSRRRKEYSKLWQSAGHEHIKFVRFENPQQAEKWFRDLRIECVRQ